MRTSRPKKIGIVIAIAVFLLLCIFPENVRAEGITQMNVYYYSFDDDGKEYFDKEVVNIFESTDKENIVNTIFKYLFNKTEDVINLIPNNAKVLDTKIKDDILILDLSEQIRNYGGCAYENALIKLFAKNASNIEGINRLTIKINGRVDVLAEGRIIFNAEIGELLSAD